MQVVAFEDDLYWAEGRRQARGAPPCSLLRVPVTVGAYTGSWIFDTGANLSVISQSVADRLGIQVSSASASSQGSSGRSVPVRTAVIADLRLGSAAIHNVAVLVAAAADLNFSSLDYQIEGSLGLPVLAALGKIRK